MIEGLWSLPRLPALRTAWRPTAAPWKSLRDSHSRLENAPLPHGSDAFPTGTTAPATTRDQDKKGGTTEPTHRGREDEHLQPRNPAPTASLTLRPTARSPSPEWAFTFSGIGILGTVLADWLLSQIGWLRGASINDGAVIKLFDGGSAAGLVLVFGESCFEVVEVVGIGGMLLDLLEHGEEVVEGVDGG